MIFKNIGAALFSILVSLPATAASLSRIATGGDLGNISFQHWVMNEAGDFVGVSNSRVFAGNTTSRSVARIFAADNTNFVLAASTSFQVDGPSGQTTINVSIDVLSSRLALNAAGDFVLASNTRLLVGNARSRQVREVANAGAFADFQTVKINDAGQYAAISAKKIFGGRVDDLQATELLGDAAGIFEIAGIYGYQDVVDGAVGEQRLALNAAGQFIAATRSAVYVGDLNTMTVTAVAEQRGVGFKHVAINDQGQISVVTRQDVYVGTAN